MGKRQHKKRRKQSPAELAGDYEIYRIGVLDGIRAIAIFLVAWYHIWQQSWLQPLTEHVNLDWLVRNGSILVDMMILLSGFCLRRLPGVQTVPYSHEIRAAGIAEAAVL